MKRLHIQVYGRVQGVGFRYACCRAARALGVTGWVRNRPDESVEIVAEGPSAALEAFGDWCRCGPDYAEVDRVIATPEPARGECLTFDIR